MWGELCLRFVRMTGLGRWFGGRAVALGAEPATGGEPRAGGGRHQRRRHRHGAAAQAA